MSNSQENVSNFVNVSLNTLNGLNREEDDGKYFENMFNKYGKELDESSAKTFSFLLDTEIDMKMSPFNTINEINVVFNKSKLLYPNQFAYMQINKNVYIENPKPGDWLQLNINDIEEGLMNLKDKNQRSVEDSVKHVTTITEKIPRSSE